jgi:UDP-N-acetylmuramyl pentapeptide synthase
MRAAIEDLAETAAQRAGGRASGRMVAVLGDMLELGPDGPALHREVGEHAATRGVGLLVSVGPLAKAIADGFGGESVSLRDAASAARELPALLREGDTVLLKASRGVGLEQVAEAMRAATRGADPGGSGGAGAGAQGLAGTAGPGRR